MSDLLILNPHLQIVRCGNDEILVKQGTRSLFSESIADEDRNGILGSLVQSFRTGAAVDEVLADFDEARDVAATFITGLRERHVLIDPHGELGALYTETFYGADLAGAKVTVVGAGALGEAIASQIREAGVGHVSISDPRRGDSIAIDDIFAGTDLVVLAWEELSPRLFTEVNLAAIDAGVPWLACYLDGHEAIVGPTTVPGESACWFEYLAQAEASITQKDSYQVYKDHLLDKAVATVSDFSPPPLRGIAAGLAATTILKTLTGQAVPTLNRAIRVDLDRFSVDYQQVLRLPRCPACGPQRPAYRQLFL